MSTRPFGPPRRATRRAPAVVRPVTVLATALLAAVVLEAGCAGPPARRPLPAAVPAMPRWTAPVDTTAPVEARVERTWWHAFGDSTLDALEREALESNWDLRAAAARVRQAAALARIAGADRLPQVGASGSVSRSRTNILGFPTPTGKQNIEILTTTWGVSLDASWEIDLWNRIGRARAAALADLAASRADVAAARLSVTAQTARTWFALVEAREQVELAERILASYERSAERIERRYRSGARTALDVRLARAAVAGARSALSRRRQQLDVLARQLEILLGRYPAAGIEADGALPHPHGAVPAGLPSTLLLRRPDLVAAERRYAAAEARAGQARRAFFPRLTLTGSNGSQTDAFERLLDGDFSVWRLAAGVVQPLFQGGRLVGDLQRSNAEADQALAAWAGAVLRAFGEVESALVAEREAAERERAARVAARESRAALRIAEAQYRSGVIDVIALLETQRQAFQARSTLLAARRERLDARIDLILALGGGYDVGPASRTTTRTIGASRTPGGSR